jgi:hypothetical protein
MPRPTPPTPVALAVSSQHAIASVLLAAPPAAAQDSAQDATNSCPALTRAKYPFIECSSNEYGGVTLSMPGQPAPVECHLRLANGDCAASPEVWRLAIPLIGPGPTD